MVEGDHGSVVIGKPEHGRSDKALDLPGFHIGLRAGQR
jgi:hypothetical protein